MVLFCFGEMVSKSFDGDKYAVYETSLNLPFFAFGKKKKNGTASCQLHTAYCILKTED